MKKSTILKRARRRLSYGPATVAEETGIPQARLDDIENDRDAASDAELETLAGYYGLDWEQLQ